jgi:hypothetical protein
MRSVPVMIHGVVLFLRLFLLETLALSTVGAFLWFAATFLFESTLGALESCHGSFLPLA